MQAIRAPFVGIVVAVALLCVENLGAVAYRAHVSAVHARIDRDSVREQLIEQLTRKIDQAERLVPRCIR